jgi:fatty acid desaturase
VRQRADVEGFRRSDALSAVIVVSHFGFTYLPVYIAAASTSGIVLLGCWIWFGLFNNGLINLMHECAHRLTFRRGWVNDFVGGFILGPLVITNFDGYRERHWEHHRHLGTPSDPKLVYRTDIRGPRVLKLVIRSLLGWEALRRLTERPDDPASEAGAKNSGVSARVAVLQIAFFGSILALSVRAHGAWAASLLAAGLAYGFVYAYGLGSLTVLAAAIRALAEHQIGDDGAPTRGQAALRNLRCNALTRLLFGAYGFSEHATHHSLPAVPYYRLPELTASLARTDPTLIAKNGYLGTLAQLVTPTVRKTAGSAQGPGL